MKVQSENQVYDRLKLLGEGAFGKAYLVKEKATDQLCVIKQMNIAEMSAAEQEETFKEAKILEALNHPNIVKFKDVYITTSKKLNIVMEYADGGDISKRIAEQKKLAKPFPEATILDWFTQLCLAIKHVHDRKIIHRDIKGQNVFITKGGMLKLGDFGIARILNRTMEKARTVVGTPYYLSPEIIENKPYSFKSDIWSMGVMLYEMCALQPPFNANSLQFLALKIVKGSYQPLQGNFSKEIKNLISSMLNVDPNRRPSAKEILQLPFILSRINSFLTETQNKVEFSHTVLHNFVLVEETQKLNFKVPSVQQLQQAQTPASQPLQQPSSYQAERARLKEQQAKLQRERQEARRDEARRQDEARKEEQRRQKMVDEQRRSEERKRAEDYQRLLEAKKRELEAEQRRIYERQKQEERREKKQCLEEEEKKRQYLQFAKAEWHRNQQIRRNAEKRAQMENIDFQAAEPEESRPKTPTPPTQIQKPASTNEMPKQPQPQKSNYHFKEEPTKPLVEAYKQLQQPSSQRPSSQNRSRQPEPVVDDEQLMNAYANPNFKKKAGQTKPAEVKKQQRPSSSVQKKDLKPQPSKDNTDLKKKIEEGRMKMRQDRQRHHNSTGDIADDNASQDTEATIPDETFKAAKWNKPSLPPAPSPEIRKPKSQQLPLEVAEQTGHWNQPIIKANTQDLNQIIRENELLEKEIQQQVLQEEKESSEMQNMIEELKKVVNDVQEKVEALPPLKVKLDVRKDDEVQPQRATDFHQNTVYENSDANLEYFSDYNKLESLRMALEDVFGTENFIRAYRIIEKQFETNGMAAMEMDQIQKKIDFISEEQFAQHFTMLLTLVVMENKVDEEARSPNR